MQFILEGQNEAVEAVGDRLCAELTDGKRVLWLVSGGSNVATEVEIMKLVHERAADRLSMLAILPMDERYGELGHANSNTQALREAGFDAGSAVWLDVLIRDLPLTETVAFYSDAAATALANAQVVIGQFGLGPDGHTAGILPNSPAATADTATVIGYEWQDYTRMTLSAEALKQVTAGYVLAYGDNKYKALHQLQKNTATFKKLPCKLLYEISEVYVYNDQLEK
jgi:6-phosphogluconolactonase/glucosamine-6-phosphate isomerase/deaminase